VFFPGRVYDPTLGRFLQADPFVQDPADPQMLNRYSYVRNNPLNFVDPSGYRRGWFRRLIAAVVSAFVAVVVTIATENPYAGAAAGAATYAAITAISAQAASSSASSPTPTAASSESSSPRGPPSPAPAAAQALPGHAASFLSPVRYTDAAAAAEEDFIEQETLQDSWSPFDFIGPGEILGAGNSILYGLKGLGTGGFLRIGAEEAESRGAIVIGENMDRVQKAGRILGAKVFRGKTNAGNARFINRAKIRGDTIYDIGPDFARRAERLKRGIPLEGPGYNLERKLTVDYSKIRRLWKRTGKYSGE